MRGELQPQLFFNKQKDGAKKSGISNIINTTETAPSIPICTRFLKLLLSAVVFTAFVPELFIRPSLLFEFNSQEDLRLIRCHHFEIKSPESVLQIQGFDIPSYVLLSSRL